MKLFKNLFKTKPKTDLKALINDGALVVDVRTKDEYSKGHIDGSINIPLMDIGRHLKEFKRNEYPLVIVCETGARSGMACDVLKKNQVIVYDGGKWMELDEQLNNW
jgi:rhodanese-related sulfurtransferase